MIWISHIESTDFTPSTIRNLIISGEIDARISISRSKVIFAFKDLISDGIMSMEEGEEIIRKAKEVLTTEQLLHRKKKEDIVEAYNRFVKKIECKNLSLERKERDLDQSWSRYNHFSLRSDLKVLNKSFIFQKRFIRKRFAAITSQ